ncbi:hypothetical protein NC653_026654 [Populus alba x Populus x berolinensis]|uniref:Uncharacterized protein n=1 Tax=Populus alba x Populus x berolinensis TaxID=444605 RepID=A0AAD6MEM9_9ROSI|nr:hypothetical protein NC653_026654 [Populus alba x Populus x berolinensis]
MLLDTRGAAAIPETQFHLKWLLSISSVSIASDTYSFPPMMETWTRVVEGHRRYRGLKKTILLDRKRLGRVAGCCIRMGHSHGMSLQLLCGIGT